MLTFTGAQQEPFVTIPENKIREALKAAIGMSFLNLKLLLQVIH